MSSVPSAVFRTAVYRKKMPGVRGHSSNLPAASPGAATCNEAGAIEYFAQSTIHIVLHIKQLNIMKCTLAQLRWKAADQLFTFGSLFGRAQQQCPPTLSLMYLYWRGPETSSSRFLRWKPEAFPIHKINGIMPRSALPATVYPASTPTGKVHALH